ncbi:ATP-binding protein, partial [bacterium]|nr:ATP-binding protein [bacterium]
MSHGLPSSALLTRDEDGLQVIPLDDSDDEEDDDPTRWRDPRKPDESTVTGWRARVHLLAERELPPEHVRQLLFHLRWSSFEEELVLSDPATERLAALTLARQVASEALSNTEASRLFLFPIPDAPNDLPGYERRPSRRFFAGENAPDQGLKIGIATDADGRPREAYVPVEALGRHLYAVGATGSGKSTLLRTAIRSAIARPDRGAVFVFDDHGSLVEDVLGDLPADLVRDGGVILIDTESDRAFGWNFLLAASPAERLERLGLYREIVEFESIAGNTGGPMLYEGILAVAQLVSAVSLPGRGCGALTDTLATVRDLDAAEKLLQRAHLAESERSNIREHFRLTRKREDDFWNYIAARLAIFNGDSKLRQILGQRGAYVDWAQLLRDPKPPIVLVNLAGLTETGKRVLATLLLFTLLAAAKRRPRTAKAMIVCDEFQTYLLGSNEDEGLALCRILSEGRKFGLSCLLANQNSLQLRPALRESIAANTGTVIALRCGEREAEALARRMDGVSDEDLIRLPPFRGFVAGTFRGAHYVHAFDT